MRRILSVLVLVVAGCSTAPVADFLDLVAPGGPGPRADRRDIPPPPPPRSREAPSPAPPHDAAPPLPPVPSDFHPADLDDEGQTPAVRTRAPRN